MFQMGLGKTLQCITLMWTLLRYLTIITLFKNLIFKRRNYNLLQSLLFSVESCHFKNLRKLIWFSKLSVWLEVFAT